MYVQSKKCCAYTSIVHIVITFVDRMIVSFLENIFISSGANLTYQECGQLKCENSIPYHTSVYIRCWDSYVCILTVLCTFDKTKESEHSTKHNNKSRKPGKNVIRICK